MKLDATPFLAGRDDAAEGVRAAIEQAARNGMDGVRLPSGVLRLKSTVRVQTESAAHDDGCGELHEKDVHLHLRGLRGFTLEGATDENGEPLTLLLGCHDNPIQRRLPSVLWAEDCEGLTVCGIAFSREPLTSWAGTVIETDKDGFSVATPPKEALPAETGAYCMNRMNAADGTLQGESLTIGFGYDKRFRRTAAHTLRLDDGALAEKLKAGDGLSWHQSGLTDFLLFFGGCDRLTLCNLAVRSANSFALLTENCRGITAVGLRLKPQAGRYFTGPRDGWKIYRCGGDILVEDSRFEGFRMDAQNVQSNFLVLERQERDVCVFACRYAPIPLQNGCALRLHTPSGERAATIKAWRFLEGRMERAEQSRDVGAGRVVEGARNHITRYELRVDGMPENCPTGMLAEPLCWEPSSYTCRRTVFRNIAGAGHLIRCRNVLLEHNVYEHLMCAGVMIGAELDTHQESGHGRDVTIRHNTFSYIGVKPRYGVYGCAAIAVKSEGFDGTFNQNILVEDNTFRDCSRAIELRDCREIVIRRNTYVNVKERLFVDPQTTERISREEETT